MTSNPDNFESMLRTAFLKAELTFLQEQPAFAQALEKVKTHDDFIKLGELGEQILSVHRRANPAARDFRHGRKDAAASSSRNNRQD
jgi:hypothetical protein